MATLNEGGGEKDDLVASSIFLRRLQLSRGASSSRGGGEMLSQKRSRAHRERSSTDTGMLFRRMNK